MGVRFGTKATPCVDIYSATAEIRRGKKKKERRITHMAKNIMLASTTQGGHNYAWKSTPQVYSLMLSVALIVTRAFLMCS